jgi:hypothetical protein
MKTSRLPVLSFRLSSSGYGAAVTGGADGLTETGALGIRPEHWRGFLGSGLDDGVLATIRAGERTGRPLGDADFIKSLEASTRRELARRKPGPKPATADLAKQGRLV